MQVPEGELRKQGCIDLFPVIGRQEDERSGIGDRGPLGRHGRGQFPRQNHPIWSNSKALLYSMAFVGSNADPNPTAVRLLEARKATGYGPFQTKEDLGLWRGTEFGATPTKERSATVSQCARLERLGPCLSTTPSSSGQWTDRASGSCIPALLLRREVVSLPFKIMLCPRHQPPIRPGPSP